MKTYDERTKYILEQRDSRLAKRRKIRSVITTAALSACSLAIVAGTTAAMSRIHKNGGAWTSPNDSNTSSHGTAEITSLPNNTLTPTIFKPQKIYPRNSDDIDNILEINDDFSFTMPEFPNEEFRLKKGILYRGSLILYSGQPIHSLYLADLNGDGYREICSDVSIGLSGVIDMHIVAFDLVNNSLYELAADLGSEYHITFENGIIGYERGVYSETVFVDQKGVLSLSVMSKKAWIANYSYTKTETKPTPITIYERSRRSNCFTTE